MPLETVRAEAAAWVACLHGASRSPALEAGLRRWLEAEASHQAAFELATEAWELGSAAANAGLPRLRAEGARESGVHAGMRRARALAAALGIVAVGSAWWLVRAPNAITTRIGEQRMLTLADGSRIYLNTDTRVLVEQDRHRRSARLESGEVLFEVAKDPRRPFIVSAGDKEILALGTTFLVRREGERIAVTLMEGRIQVDGGPAEGAPAVAANAQFLTPGQRLTFSGGEEPRLDAPELSEVTAWQRGEVVLDGTRLADAVQEMNRYSTLPLAVEPGQAAIRVSGVFRAGDSAQFASAVGEIYGLRILARDGGIVISGARK